MNILDLFDRPIAYHRCFAAITGSVTAAVMLSQAFYWCKRTTLAGNWFWKTQEDWFDETGLTRYEQEGARKILRKLGIFEEKKEGIPAKLYFRVNIKIMNDLLEITPKPTFKPSEIKDVDFPHPSKGFDSNLEEGKPADKEGEKPLYNTESTTETTSESVCVDARAENSLSDFEEPAAKPIANELTAAAVCVQLTQLGLMTNPSHPKLLALLAEGANMDDFNYGGLDAANKGKNFGWALAVVQGSLNDRLEKQRHPAPAKVNGRPQNVKQTHQHIDYGDYEPSDAKFNSIPSIQGERLS